MGLPIWSSVKNHIEKSPKKRKNDPSNRKKWNFQNISKVLNLYWYKVL